MYPPAASEGRSPAWPLYRASPEGAPSRVTENARPNTTPFSKPTRSAESCARYKETGELLTHARLPPGGATSIAVDATGAVRIASYDETARTSPGYPVYYTTGRVCDP